MCANDQSGQCGSSPLPECRFRPLRYPVTKRCHRNRYKISDRRKVHEAVSKILVRSGCRGVRLFQFAVANIRGHGAILSQPDGDYCRPVRRRQHHRQSCTRARDKLGAMWKQSVVVENRPGLPGTTAVAKSAPDGYTLMLTSNGHTIAGVINKGIQFDPVKDFAGVTVIASVPLVAIVPADFP